MESDQEKTPDLRPELYLSAFESEDPNSGRNHVRLPMDVQLEIRGPGHTVRANTKDISLSGLFVESSELFEVGTICEVAVIVTSGDSQLTITGKATVMR